MKNQISTCAAKALERLQIGNNKYIRAVKPCGDISPDMRQTSGRDGQHPFAVIVACSDSRVIPEAIFSVGIGELFVIRVAGNVIGDHELGSIEYAVEHLGCRLVLVMGHDHCGAVDAAMHSAPVGYVHFLTDEIRASIGEEMDEAMASWLNARSGCRRIEEKLCLSEKVRGELLALPALYRVETGVVEFEF